MSVSRDLDGKLREFTVKDAERVIRKIEAFKGMAAKLVLLRNVLALGRAEGLEEAAKVADEFDTDAGAAIRALKEKV